MIAIPNAKADTTKVCVIKVDSSLGTIEISGAKRNYTQLALHTESHEGALEPFSVFLLDATLHFDDETTLMLHSDASGRPIWLKDSVGNLLWQEPKNVLPWVAIYHDDFLHFQGPYDRIGADVVVVSYVRGDGYFYIRAPEQYVAAITKIYPKLRKETGGAPHSKFREYTLLFQTLGKDLKWSEIVEPLLAIPNTVFLPKWPNVDPFA